MPFPPKLTKKKYDEEFEHFAKMPWPVFLRTRLTDILKMPPYAKYMKDIITNKRKIPEAEISTMLTNYTFKDGVRKIPEAEIPLLHPQPLLLHILDQLLELAHAN